MKEKIKNKLNMAIINGKYVADFEQSTETLTTQGWIKWGSDNTFPNYLLDLYKECAIHQSIVDMISQYTFGSESKSNNGDDIINSDDETLSDVINQVITDFIIFGGCMCLKSQTRGGGIDIKWLDMSKCRISEDSKKVYYNNNGWVGYNKQKNIQVFDIVKNGDGVYYYKSPKSRGIYPTPNYIGAIKCLEVERNIDIFHLSSIKNNFVANMAITFVDENYLSISDDDKDDAIDDITDSFTGANNASKCIVSWVGKKDDATIFERISDDRADEKFKSLNSANMQKIIVAHKLTSGNLIGISTEGKGFSSAEFIESFNIFNNTIIKGYQQLIQRYFLKMGIEIELNPFTYDNNTDDTNAN